MGQVKGWDVKVRDGQQVGDVSHFNHLRIADKRGYSAEVMITKFPTGNCQLSSLAYFNNLLDRVADDEAVLEILRECYRTMSFPHNIIFADVQSRWIERVKKLLGNRIVHEHAYTSTNGSSMCVFLFKGLAV